MTFNIFFNILYLYPDNKYITAKHLNCNVQTVQEKKDKQKYASSFILVIILLKKIFNRSGE